MKEESLANISEFVVAQLPDSLNERKRLLTSLADVIPAGHPKRAAVAMLLACLVAHQQQQLEFALALSTSRDGKEEP